MINNLTMECNFEIINLRITRTYGTKLYAHSVICFVRENKNIIRSRLRLNCQKVPQNTRTYFAIVKKSRFLDAGFLL